MWVVTGLCPSRPRSNDVVGAIDSNGGVADNVRPLSYRAKEVVIGPDNSNVRGLITRSLIVGVARGRFC